MTLQSIATVIVKIQAVGFFLVGVQETFGLLGRIPFYSPEEMHRTHWRATLIFPAVTFLIAAVLWFRSGAIARFVCRKIDRS